jgi:hypothetical protein
VGIERAFNPNFHEEHQTEWKNNTILINYTLIYLKFGIADCNSAE